MAQAGLKLTSFLLQSPTCWNDTPDHRAPLQKLILDLAFPSRQMQDAYRDLDLNSSSFLGKELMRSYLGLSLVIGLILLMLFKCNKIWKPGKKSIPGNYGTSTGFFSFLPLKVLYLLLLWSSEMAVRLVKIRKPTKSDTT